MSAIANGTAVSETSRPSVGSPGVFTSRKRGGGSASAMNWVALRILTGDRAKYLGLIFAIAFSTFLIAQQSSLFVVVINRTRSFIVDVTDADIWVMAPATRYLDEVFSLKGQRRGPRAQRAKREMGRSFLQRLGASHCGRR